MDFSKPLGSLLGIFFTYEVVCIKIGFKGVVELNFEDCLENIQNEDFCFKIFEKEQMLMPFLRPSTLKTEKMFSKNSG